MAVTLNLSSTYSLFFLWFIASNHLSYAEDRITANESLSGDQTIVSSGGRFTLGFFNPDRNFSNHYIGIWYSRDRSRLVWVANRERPVTSFRSSELKIRDGNLVLVDNTSTPIWSTNISSRASDSVVAAVLRNDGNLVFTDSSDVNTKTPLWQSFDFPTNVLLPGSKLAYNKLTRTSHFLTSWKNSEDPSPGLYSLEIDPNSTQYVVRWNRSEEYLVSQSWHGQNFSLVPNTRFNYIYNYSFVDTENESYFTYSLYNPANDSFLMMDVSGQIKQLTWLDTEWNLDFSQPSQQCDVYAYCGAFGVCDQNSLPFCNCLYGFRQKSEEEWNLNDYSGGCVRETNMACGNSSGSKEGEKDKFWVSTGMVFPNHSQLVSVSGAAECELACLGNCSCTAYAYDNRGCSLWSGELLNLQQLASGDSRGRTIYIRLASSEFSSGKSNAVAIVIIVTVVLTVVLVVCGLGYIFYKRKIWAGTVGHTTKVLMDEDHIKGNDATLFNWKSIITATENFSEANKLGEGGFGPVYKGQFRGEQWIAVKRLSSRSGQGIQEFRNEVVLIAKLQHRNLVRLLGYCVERGEKILLYEYMPNKSLDKWIFDTSKAMLLDWQKRFDIILGITRGLLYLHQDSRLRIIHRDLKTSNILLDEDMNPKISDFGLARIVVGTLMEANTNKVVGTYGYMSPEYAIEGLFSIKSDVFSFGVIVLEIVSGKRNTSFYHSTEYLNLLSYAWKLWQEDRALELLDSTITEPCDETQVLKSINIGLLCVQEDHNDRPTMAEVISMLGSESVTIPSPKQPSFVARRPTSDIQPLRSEILSHNTLTISVQEGR